ncbi:DUF6397 family protein [Actinacidiphila sp. DG2A-62]|uniref:DUF6397 family protein n=1 Tax=Actinacidiphila sp. DG2A-62 TaxID=3108821 RepID=UPI002DBD7614|nr:DUF6397 family protein [Actinacidiphila sp. DG2A-62]MEC3998362.1 DUF6397 family protein [Actinacidiphila sp. DG2A-62]
MRTTGTATVRGAGRDARRDANAVGGAGELVALNRVRDALGLEFDEFEVALQVGEVRTVVCGPAQWKVPRAEFERLLAERDGPDGGPEALRERVRLVSSGGAAEAMGASRNRFALIARAGEVRPVRWYVNRYGATVWLYRAREMAEFAERRPDWLKGRLPQRLRETEQDALDLRARAWRERRVAHLVRDAYDAWDEAAVWAALLGPDAVGEAVPDPGERARLRRLRETLPPGRPGRASPQTVRNVVTADDPDEIGHALLRLADALSRARARQPAPRPIPRPSPPIPRPVSSQAARDLAPRGQGRPRGLRRLMLGLRRPAGRAPGGPGGPDQSSPTPVRRITARLSSSEAARSTSAQMPQP